jgi:hypothetical protein
MFPGGRAGCPGPGSFEPGSSEAPAGRAAGPSCWRPGSVRRQPGVPASRQSRPLPPEAVRCAGDGPAGAAGCRFPDWHDEPNALLAERGVNRAGAIRRQRCRPAPGDPGALLRLLRRPWQRNGTNVPTRRRGLGMSEDVRAQPIGIVGVGTMGSAIARSIVTRTTTSPSRSLSSSGSAGRPPHQRPNWRPPPT